MGISFKNVSYRYKDENVTAQLGLDDVTLELTEGRMIALLGAPGSGKSTLLQHLNGLLVPDQGRIHILDFTMDSQAASDVPNELRRRVGLVFQYPESQLFEATVEKDLLFGPLNFGATEAEASQAALIAAEAIGLDAAVLTKNPFELSSGQMRKAAVAAVLASDPDILVLDEPTASLDPASRIELMQMLHNLCQQHGKTIIVITHRLEEAISYADEYVVLSHGKVIFQGSESALLEREEILTEAGIITPASVRLASKIAERFTKKPPNPSGEAAELAQWLKNEIFGACK